MRSLDSDATGFLPLPPATFHILVAVADQGRHGYAIIQDVAARTNGELKLSPGTLYRSIQRMLEDGLIVEPRERPARSDDDERRRYYRVTPLGEAVAASVDRRVLLFAACLTVRTGVGSGPAPVLRAGRARTSAARVTDRESTAAVTASAPCWSSRRLRHPSSCSSRSVCCSGR